MRAARGELDTPSPPPIIPVPTAVLNSSWSKSTTDALEMEQGLIFESRTSGTHMPRPLPVWIDHPAAVTGPELGSNGAEDTVPLLVRGVEAVARRGRWLRLGIEKGVAQIAQLAA